MIVGRDVNVTRQILITVVAAALALAATGSLAQSGYEACSLEWLVARADVVVRASVVSVTHSTLDGDPGMVTVTLKVQETLKGAPAETRAFNEHSLLVEPVYGAWKDAQREQLWFLVRKPKREDAPGASPTTPGDSSRQPLELLGLVRLGPAVFAEKAFTELPPPIFTMSLELLDKPQDILAAARRAVTEGNTGQPVRRHLIDLPRVVMQRSGRSGDANELVVPVDSRLESVARRLINSPAALVSAPGDSSAQDADVGKAQAVARFRDAEKDRLRAEGVKALQYFKSDENAGILKSLLKDKAWRIDISPEGDARNVYYIRKEAYTILREWGIKVAKPALDAPL